MSKLYDLPFDQFQRYKLVSTLVDELRGKDESLEILDVGGRTALLRQFLKKDHITLVDLEASAEKDLVLGDGSALPFADASFDLVCAFDTLEHVPPPRRARFVRECARVSRRWVVLAGPYQSEEVEEAEKLLQRFLKQKLGVRHRYLEEHRHHGLPERQEVEQQFEKLGARVVSLGHGNVQRWLALISMALYMDHTPALQSLAVRLHRFYNRGLFGEDEEPPVYRHAVVAALGDARLPQPRPVPTQAHPPARELLHFAQELAAFDAQRDGHQAEFERLQGVIRDLEADLAGHKQTLQSALERRDEAQRVAQDLKTDLKGHKQAMKELSQRHSESEAVIKTLRSDLEGHQQSLKEASAKRAEAEDVIRTLKNDLNGHRRSLRELRELRAESEQVIATLQKDLEGHRGSLQELSQNVARYEGLLAEHRTLIGERERELGLHARVLDELRVILANLDAEKNKLLGLRESERRDYESVREELEQQIDALLSVRSELKRELSAHESHGKELEQLLKSEHEAFAREQQRLSQEREAAAQAWLSEREQFSAIVAARDAELERHVVLQGELRAHIEALDGERAKLAGLLERERGEAGAVRAELVRELELLRGVQEEAGKLEREVRAERAAFAAEQQRLQAERSAAERTWLSERSAFQAVIAARDAELGRHAALQRDLQRELAEHRQVLAERERELAQHREVTADLRADLAGHRALAAEQQSLLGQREAELKDAQAHDQRTQAELAHARDQLADLRAALERARGEITAAAGALVEKERVIVALRTELRGRLRSLLRAFGPSRPSAGE